MAISGVSRSYDQATAIRDSLEDTISMISPFDTPLVAMLNRVDVDNIKHEWIEDALRGDTSTLAAALGSDIASVTVYVQSGHGAARFPVASNYPIQIRIDEEMMLVTSRVTNALAVTRDYNSTGTAAHSSSARIDIVADHTLEGADARNAHAQSRSRPWNATQIFQATIQTSGSEIRAIAAGIDSEQGYQEEQRLREMKIQLEKALVSGTRIAGTGSTYRTMRGMWEWIDTNKTNAGSAAITEEFIEADAQTCYDAGGSPGVLLCGSFQARKITNIYKDRIRSAPETIFGGAQIQRITLPIAGSGELAIVPSRFVPPHEYYMLDMSRIFLGRYRPFFLEDLAKTGDSEKSEVVGEYTLVLKNETAHARRYGLATS